MNSVIIQSVIWSGVIFIAGFLWGCLYAEWRRKKSNKGRLTISMPTHADEGPDLLKAFAALIQKLRDNKENT